MKNNLWGILAVIFLLTSCVDDPSKPENLFKPISFDFPQPFRDTLFADTLHGMPVPDPYRWMEAEEAPILQEWLREESKLTQQYFSKIAFSEPINKRLQELWDYSRISCPRKNGDFLYFLKNNGLQAQDVLCRQSLLSGEEEILLDPNTFPHHQTTSLKAYSISTNGRFIALETTERGADWRTIRVLDLQENTLLEDSLLWVKYSQMAWAGDGFFYSRYPPPLRGAKTSTPMEFHQVYYHRVGTAQSSDPLIFADRARFRRGFSPKTSQDGRFLVLNIWETHSGNGIYAMDLQKENPQFVPIVDDMANEFTFIGSKGNHLLFLTNFEADRRKLIKVSMAKPDPGYWEDVIPEGPALLENVYLAGGKLVAHYLQDAQSQLRVYEMNGAASNYLSLPGMGTVSDFQGLEDEDRAFFSFESFLSPPIIYELDLQLLTARVFNAPKVNFNAGDYETRMVYFESLDGFVLPLFITLKKGIKLDSNHPTLLTGDGSFNQKTTPRFNPSHLCILENGGILAHAILRGGGEFGWDWYRKGVRAKKQQTFSDFQAAAEYLISQGYTKKEKLLIEGNVSGGLLVGVSITQRPDLFQAAIASSGIYDMIRYQQFTIGSKWAFDFGRSEQSREFDYLNAYSPLHNVLKNEFPATLLIAGEEDDRVYPAHSYKFAAALQAQQLGPQPILLLVNPHAGSGTGKSTEAQIKENTDRLSFFFYHLKQAVVYE